MRSTSVFAASRWVLLAGCGMLAVTFLACATDNPATPSEPAARPAAPTPSPAAPTAAGAATLTVSQSDVVFNAAVHASVADTSVVTVTASSGGSLAALTAATRYADGQPDGWLVVALDRTVVPAKVTLRATTAALPAGEYTATITLAAPGVIAQDLTITSRVVSGPAIGLSAAKICFTMTLNDNSPNPDDVRVTSVDGTAIDGLTATVVFDAGQPTGWLYTRFDGTSTPARLWLYPNIVTQPAGTYTATVLVASPQAGNSPVPIRVTLTINEVDPAKVSRLIVHLTWEGPQNGGYATIQGNHGVFCQSYPGHESPGPNCRGELLSGLGDITLGTDADYGARFLRWEGACSGLDCTVHFVTPGTTQEVTGVFGSRPSLVQPGLQGNGASGTLTISAPVTSQSSGGPVSCRLVNGERLGACDGIIQAGAGTFTLTATPDPGSVFVGWHLFALGPHGPPFETCVDNAPTCTITFTQGGSVVDGWVTLAPASGIVLPTALGASPPGRP